MMLHPRLGVFINTCHKVSSTSGIKRHLEARGQAGSKESEPGVRALGVVKRPRAHALAPGRAPQAPFRLQVAVPQFSCMGKTVFKQCNIID